MPPEAVDPKVKNFQWGDFIRGLFEAYDRDALLPILTDGEGDVTEGPGFNVFALVDGELRTPDRGVLEGITRLTVLDIARELGIRTRVARLPARDLARAHEILLSSTAGGVMPVARAGRRARRRRAGGSGPIPSRPASATPTGPGTRTRGSRRRSRTRRRSPGGRSA